MLEGAGYFSVCVVPDPPPGGIETVFNITASLVLTFNDSAITASQQVELSSNSTMACHNFTLEDDNVFEENSLAMVTLSSMHQRVEIVNGMAEIIIEDDDGMCVFLIPTVSITTCVDLYYRPGASVEQHGECDGDGRRASTSVFLSVTCHESNNRTKLHCHGRDYTGYS